MSDEEAKLKLAKKYELLDPDVRLMLQVKAGDAAAFEALVEKYQARLVGILRHMVSNKEQAEDLAQEVFLRVYRARERYVPMARFSTWLFTITHNVASSALLKRSRRKEVNLTNSPSGSMPTRPLDTMAKEKSSLMPTRQVDRDELSTIMRQAIDQLGDRQRMALLLSRFEGMSYQEIADTMELSPQAVKSLLSRARLKLKTIVEPYVNSGVLPGQLADSASESNEKSAGDETGESFKGSVLETNTLSSQTIGTAALAPGRFAAHTTFSVGENFVGRFVSSVKPLKFGPRNCAQFSANADEEISTKTMMIDRNIVTPENKDCGPEVNGIKPSDQLTSETFRFGNAPAFNSA